MEFAGTAYTFLSRKLTAVLFLGFILSFVSVNKAHSFPNVTAENEWFCGHITADDPVEVINSGSPNHASDLLIRGKVKVKAFFKKTASDTQIEPRSYRVCTAVPTASAGLLTDRPGYYNFLFRYTPF